MFLCLYMIMQQAVASPEWPVVCSLVAWKRADTPAAAAVFAGS
jgi:hypothetical protein